MKKIILLDVSAIMYRAYFANMKFRTKNEPTGAIYGFINSLLSIINEFKPDYMGAAFDIKKTELKRREIYPEYKIKRDSVPEDLLVQIPRIETLLDYFNINRFKIDGYEADDVLGSLSKKFASDEVEVIIISGDKDLAQLVGNDLNVKVAIFSKNGDGDKFKIIQNDSDVVEYLGVNSFQIPDLFGLIGDSSDGIPGVRKIGPKKAIPMIELYGSLEEVYNNIDKLSEISGVGKSIIDNLILDKDIAFLSKELATINSDLEINASLSDLTYNMNKEKLFSFFKELDFKSLIKKLDLNSSNDMDSNLFENSVETTKIIDTTNLNFKSENRDFKIIDNSNLLDDLLIVLNSKELISIFWKDVGMALTTDDTDYYFPLFSQGLLNKNINLHDFKTFFSKIKPNIISYDFKEFLNLGFNPTNIDVDFMIAYHLVSSKTKISINEAISYFTDIKLPEYSEIFEKKLSNALSNEEYGNFLIEKSKGMFLSYNKILEILNEKNLLAVLKEIEIPLIEILSSMELKGIKIDSNYFKNYSSQLGSSLLKLEEDIYSEAGENFNINSPKQLGDILFNKLQLPTAKKTKTGFSTDVEVLEILEEKGFPIANLLLEYRKLFKLKNTYVDPLPKMVDSNQRLHTTFHQIGTVTGRLSSSDPNLQNIPAKSDEGMKIRKGFIADKDNFLLSIDYSQIELRVLAQFSKDANLILAYKNNEDLHNLTARKLFHIKDAKDVTREQRDIAKTINFSVIYGKTPFGLAKELKITQKDAKHYIETYFNEYPKVSELKDKIVSFAETHGYVETYFKRRREITGINSKNKIIKNQAERMAINTVIQGTASEILKKVMIKIYEYTKNSNEISLLLQVHDELIFEVEKNTAELHKEKLIEIMENTIILDDVKLVANANIGETWGDIK